MSKPDHSIKRLHAIVQGRVQGVFYRAWTQQQAQSLGLRGWVRNRPEGTVELVAQGPRPALEDLLQRAHRGPPAAQVEDIQVQWQEDLENFSSFEIR